MNVVLVRLGARVLKETELARAYELQEVLKRERNQVKTHEKEYNELMDKITRSKVQHIGSYKVVQKAIQKNRHIVSDEFRKRWPDLFNKLARVTIKSAQNELNDEDIYAVCEVKEIIKPIIERIEDF
jgi:hypothetical protein